MSEQMTNLPGKISWSAGTVATTLGAGEAAGAVLAGADGAALAAALAAADGDAAGVAAGEGDGVAPPPHAARMMAAPKARADGRTRVWRISTSSSGSGAEAAGSKAAVVVLVEGRIRHLGPEGGERRPSPAGKSWR
jgi:hypothetical protein